MEAWKEMQERAWEVGMTARKKRRESAGVGDAEEGGGDDQREEESPRRSATADEAAAPSIQRDEGLLKLEERQKGVLTELDGLEEKYRSLFALANAA